MPLPFSGGQLPISAFFGTSAQSSKRIKSSRTSAKRKASPDRKHEAEPSRKKRKKKENVSPHIKGSIGLGECPELLKDAQPELSGNVRPKTSSPTKTDGDALASLRYPDADVGRPSSSANQFICVSPTDSTHLTPEDHPYSRHPRPVTPPPTPHAQKSHASVSAENSLLTPSLTAPKLKGLQNQSVRERPEDASENSPSDAIDTRSLNAPAPDSDSKDIKDKDLCLKNTCISMPPPPIPSHRILSSSAPPHMPPLRERVRSPSLERWVPSSQSQERSMPMHEELMNDRPTGKSPWPMVGDSPRVVPSSQSSELEIPLSPLQRPLPSPLQLSIPSAPLSIVGDTENQDEPSPEIVESSQSQFETEITEAWAKTMGERRAAIGWDGQVGPLVIPSSLSLPTESQEYQANDEYSSSQDLTESSSSSYYSRSLSSTPSPLRRFKAMFEGRDDYGRPLPSTETAAPLAQHHLRRLPTNAELGQDSDPEDVIGLSQLIPTDSFDESSSYGTR